MCIGWKDLTYPEIVCPDCEGYGYEEVLTHLFYNGYVGTRNDRCERCKGEGFVIDEKEEREECLQ